jgi:hypothetical protein
VSRVGNIGCDAFVVFIVACIVISVSMAVVGIGVLTLHFIGVPV